MPYCPSCKRTLTPAHFKLNKSTKKRQETCVSCLARINSYSKRNENLKSLGFASYKEYLASQIWKDIRAKVYAIKGRQCYLCNKPADAVHHNRYDVNDLTGKRLKYVSPICNYCHENIEFVEGRKVGVGKARGLFKKQRYETAKFRDSRSASCSVSPA